MRHFGMLILSLLPSGLTALYVYLIAIIELPLTLSIFFAAVFVSAIYLGLMFVFNLIDSKIRDIDAFEFIWYVNFVLTPFRLPLQIITCIFAIIGAFTDKIDVDYYYYETFTSLFFNFDFVSGKPVTNYGSAKPSATYNNYSGGGESGTATVRLKKDPYAMENAVDKAIRDAKFYHGNTSVYLGNVKWESSNKQISKINQTINVNVKLKYYHDSSRNGFFDYVEDESTIRKAAEKIKVYLQNKLLRAVGEVQREYEGFDCDWKIRVAVNLS